MVPESSPEEGFVLEVSGDLGVQRKPPRTLVLLGRSGNGKSATGNSILGRQAFKSKRHASGVTTVCELQSATLPNGQILNVIDTPGNERKGKHQANESFIYDVYNVKHVNLDWCCRSV